MLVEIEKFNETYNNANPASYIIVSSTKDRFDKNDLLFFNGVNVFATFVLLNTTNNEVFCYPKTIWSFGLNTKRIVREIRNIISEQSK